MQKNADSSILIMILHGVILQSEKESFHFQDCRVAAENDRICPAVVLVYFRIYVRQQKRRNANVRRKSFE